LLHSEFRVAVIDVVAVVAFLHFAQLSYII
jgi:hypothetical protein